MTLPDEKSRLRREMKSRRAETSAAERGRASAHLCQRLWPFLQQHAVQNVGVYLATPAEISLDPLIEMLLNAGIEVGAPRADLASTTMAFFRLNSLSDVQIGPWNLREPASDTQIHPIWILVPGVAFDENGHRLGMGAGWYDRTLTPQIKKVGIAYDFQLVPRVPVEVHDLPMNWVFTEQRTLGHFDEVLA